MFNALSPRYYRRLWNPLPRHYRGCDPHRRGITVASLPITAVLLHHFLNIFLFPRVLPRHYRGSSYHVILYVIPRWRTSSSSGVGVSKASAFRFVSWTVCSVPHTRLSTYGDWAFPVAAVQIWNSLLQHITSSSSLPVFCSQLMTYFFELYYP